MCDNMTHLYKDTQAHVCVNSGTEEYGGCLSLCPNRVLSGLRLVSIWIIMCVAGLLSMLRDRAGTHTSKHTPTQKPHHSKSSPYDKDTGNNDELMPTTDTHLSAHKSHPDIKSVFFFYLSVCLSLYRKEDIIDYYTPWRHHLFFHSSCQHCRTPSLLRKRRIHDACMCVEVCGGKDSISTPVYALVWLQWNVLI